jgi:hypothetical protein
MSETNYKVNKFSSPTLVVSEWSIQPILNWRYFIHVGIPMFLSLLIYWICRPKEIALNHLLGSILHFQPHLDFPPSFDWVIYNLPGALWMYAFLFAFITDGNKAFFRCLLPLLIPVAIEFFQLFGITDGTVDVLDFVFYLSTWVLYFIVWLQKGNRIIWEFSISVLRPQEICVLLFFFLVLFLADIR